MKAIGAEDVRGEPSLRASAPGKRQLRSSAVDLALIAAITTGTFLSGARLELHEVFSTWAFGYEHWQLDELPATLLALAVGLSWFGYRRWREARVELARRVESERESQALLRRNRELAQRLIEAQESERRALARELHDELAQTCNAIHIEAACLINGANDQNGVHASAGRIVDATEGLYRLVHDMLCRLRPALLDSLGLVAAVQELCIGWEARTGIVCHCVAADVADTVGEPLRIALFRIVQEALSNVGRHAHATRVDVLLQRVPGGGSAAGRLFLTVQDNGCGMDPAAAANGLGLVGMRERVAALGGELTLVSAPGHGLRLEVIVPLS